MALPSPLWGPVSILFSVKRPGRGADRSASSAEMKNAWSYVSTVPHTLLEFCLIKVRQLHRREQCQVLVSAVVVSGFPQCAISYFAESVFCSQTVLCLVVLLVVFAFVNESQQ